MIHVFNAPIDPVSMVEVMEAPEGSDELFPKEEQPRRRPKLTYHTDGRRVINGELEETKTPASLWSAALVHSTARRWRKRALSTTSIDSRAIDITDSIVSASDAQDKSGSIMDWIGGWFTSKTLWWSAFGVVALYILYKKYSPIKPQWLSIKGSKG